MHALSNHFHNSSCLVTCHRGSSSRDNQRHIGQSVQPKNKRKLKDVLAHLKQDNLKGPNWRWRKQHVSTWYVDSGCSSHMTNTLELLSSYVNKEGSSMAFGGNQKGKIKEYGMIVKGEIIVSQVSYVDGLKHNLISVSQLCDNGMDVMLKIKYCIMYKADTLIKVMRANRKGDLYLLCFETLEAKEEICLVSSVKNEEAWLWHTIRLKLVKGLPDIKFEKDHLCSAYEMGKLKRSSHKTKTEPSFDKPLQMLHVDLYGPITKQSLNEKKYILVLVDEFHFIRKKSHVPMLLINLLKRLQVLHNMQVRVIRSDNGTEFKNSTIEDYLSSLGMTHNFFAPRTPQQNGVVERKNRTLVEAARTILNAFGLPLSFWAEANRSLVVKRFEKTPVATSSTTEPFKPSTSTDPTSVSTTNPSEPSNVEQTKLIHEDLNPSHSLQEITSNINLPHAIEWTKDHPQTLIIEALTEGVKTRANVNYCLFACFVSKIEPKKVTEALADPFCVEAIQDELLQF
ncbi:hypothetical protein OSB04_031747 [Centaurea solstitialis]|uniref:Integrase catalytic domain-containing protein n=1 Tax=Centaurea solstitialis TaxID=347529 RepID=A0AA38W6B3_9ASTR|nr:hypothetical protein OSB04_031747 [Centaurea solstitialis]